MWSNWFPWKTNDKRNWDNTTVECAKKYIFCTHKGWNMSDFINSESSENGARSSSLELGRKYLKSPEWAYVKLPEVQSLHSHYASGWRLKAIFRAIRKFRTHTLSDGPVFTKVRLQHQVKKKKKRQDKENLWEAKRRIGKIFVFICICMKKCRKNIQET